MRHQQIRNVVRCAGVCLAAVLLLGPSRAVTGQVAGSSVLPGYDLYQSGGEDIRFAPPGSLFDIDVQGVPFGSFDFGGTIGVQQTFDTNLIVRRTDTASLSSPTVPIEIVALQLQSVAPVDLGQFTGGTGSDHIGITLNLTESQSSSYTLSFDGGISQAADGMFSAAMNFTVDIREGGITGNILESRELNLATGGFAVSSATSVDPSSVVVAFPSIDWSHLPEGANPQLGTNSDLAISGVNLFLNGADQTQDFFPFGPFGDLVLFDAGFGSNNLGFQAAIVPVGREAENPFLPDEINAFGGFVFRVEVNPDDRFFFDPIVAIGYDFEVLGGPLVTSVLAPILPGGDDMFQLVVGLDIFDILGGVPFVLPTAASVFSILGIDPGEALDPTDELAFVVGFTFDSAGPITLTMTPITFQTTPDVPEPSSIVMFLLLGSVGTFAHRRSRRKVVCKT